MIDYDISTDEYISHALSIEGSSTGCINDPEEIDFDPINLILNNTPVYDLVIDNSSQNASGAHVIPGNAQEGRFCNTIYVQDIAGNTSLKTSTVFIDNTSPDQPVLNKQDWGKYNGKDTTPGFVAKGRLVPEYVHEEKNLHLFGLAEKDQIVSLFVNGKLIESKDLDTKDCQQIDDDTIKDQVIVRSGSICKFDFNYIFNEGETDYQIQLKTIDRSGNESIISDDEVVYLDQANPITPQTLSIKAKGQDIPNWVKAKDQEIISSRLGTGNLGKLPITNSKSVVIETLAEARSDFDLWFENPGALLSRPKTIQKSGNGIDLYPIELEMDGVYSFYSTSWDAAGNESGEHMVQIELDTLAPVVPTVSNPYVCGNNICVDASGEDGAKLFDGKNYLGIVSNGAKRFVAKYSPRYGTAYNFIFRLEDRATNSSPAVAKSFALDRAQGDGVGVLGDNDMYGGKSINDIGSTANANIFISRDDKWTISNFEIPAPLIANISNDFDGSVDIYGLALASGSKLKTKFKIRKEYYPINKAIDICGGWKASTSCVEKKSGMGRFEAMKINSFCLFQGDSCYTKYAKKVTKEITESIDLKHNEILVSKFDEDITSNRYCGVGANCYDDARRYWHSNQDAKFQFEIIPNVLSSKDKVKAKLRSFTEFDIKFNDDLKHTFKFDKQALESAWSNQVEVPDIKDFWETVVHPLAYDPNCAGFQKTDVFGSFQSFRKQPHTGVDLAKPSGCLVNSVADGIIEAQEWDYLGGGNMVLINHKNGYGTIYLHGANDSNRKSIYDKVNAGEYIFYMGNTTNPGVKMGIHLHLTLRKNNINVNPEDINYFRDLGPKGELYKNTKKY